MFLLALQFGSGNTYAWKSATIIGLFCSAGVTAIIFILWERYKGDEAMLPGSLLKQRIVWTSCVSGTSVVCCTLVASNWIPTFFQAVKGQSPITSGVHVLPSILGQLLFVVVSGALSKFNMRHGKDHNYRSCSLTQAVSRTGFYLPWAVGGAVVMAIGNGLVSTFSPTTSTAKWIVYQVIIGAGRGASLQTVRQASIADPRTPTPC